MNIPDESNRAENMINDTSLPERAGKCAYLGGYVNDGEKICHFGVEYICRAPRLVKTGNSC